MKKLVIDGKRMTELGSVELKKAEKKEPKAKAAKPANKAGKAANK